MSDDLFGDGFPPHPHAKRGDGAREAKTEGMTRVEDHADPDWLDSMADLVIEVCESRELFTSDDVFDLAALRGVSTTTHDLRAFGPVMLRAAKAGLCQKENVAPINSRRRSLHASPRAVWRSMIYTGTQRSSN